MCLCNKTVKDLGSKKRDRDRGTVTLGPAALYVTIIWGRVWMHVTTTHNFDDRIVINYVTVNIKLNTKKHPLSYPHDQSLLMM